MQILGRGRGKSDLKPSIRSMLTLDPYSILVHLNQTPGDYALRLHSIRDEQIIQGAGILRYPTVKVNIHTLILQDRITN